MDSCNTHTHVLFTFCQKAALFILAFFLLQLLLLPALASSLRRPPAAAQMAAPLGPSVFAVAKAAPLEFQQLTVEAVREAFDATSQAARESLEAIDVRRCRLCRGLLERERRALQTSSCAERRCPLAATSCAPTLATRWRGRSAGSSPERS